MACTVVISTENRCLDCYTVMTEGRPPGQRPSLSHAAIRRKKVESGAKKNLMPCYLTGLPSETTRIRMKKNNHIVVLQSKKLKHGGKQCKEWMAHFKGQTAPLVFDFKSLLKALSGKQAEAQSEVDAFMEHCAKAGRLERALVNSSDVD